MEPYPVKPDRVKRKDADAAFLLFLLYNKWIKSETTQMFLLPAEWILKRKDHPISIRFSARKYTGMRLDLTEFSAFFPCKGEMLSR